jgi:hypothetical protein
MLSDIEHKEVVRVCRYALLDIDMLLKDGFDTNIRDTKMDGIVQTIQDLKTIIRKWNEKDL